MLEWPNYRCNFIAWRWFPLLVDKHSPCFIIFWLWPPSFLPKPKVSSYWRPLRSPTELGQVGGFKESPILFLQSCKQPLQCAVCSVQGLHTAIMLKNIYWISIEIFVCIVAYLPTDWPIEKVRDRMEKRKSVKNGPDLWILDIANLSPRNPFPSYFGIFPSSWSMIPP